MAFLKQFLDKIGFSEQIACRDFIPQPGSIRGYDPSVLLESFVCSVWCGATKFIHTELPSVHISKKSMEILSLWLL